MVTLIAIYDSDGLVGRCDARCYEAGSPACECICGGANHGVGLKQAIANTQAMARQWLVAYAKEHNLESWRADIAALSPIQLALPIQEK